MNFNFVISFLKTDILSKKLTQFRNINCFAVLQKGNAQSAYQWGWDGVVYVHNIVSQFTKKEK